MHTADAVLDVLSDHFHDQVPSNQFPAGPDQHMLQISISYGIFCRILFTETIHIQFSK